MGDPAVARPPRRPGRRLALGAVLALAVAAPALAVSSGSVPGGDSGGPADGATGEPAADQRPNVVVVLADDLGWGDLSSDVVNAGHGNPGQDTPAIDRLAEEGTVFDHAYASPTCSPSRMALLTGMYSPRPDNNVFLVGGLDRGGSARELVGPRQGRRDQRLVLPDGVTTLGETMQDAGYATAYAGKFHVTRFAGNITGQHGFDENLGGFRSGAVGRYHAQARAGGAEFDGAVDPTLDAFAEPYTRSYVETEIAPHSVGVDDADLDALVGTRKHLTDALGDATLDVVDRHADQPFLAFLSHFAVHTPVGPAQPRRDLLAKYAARDRPGDDVRPSYAALLEGLDQTVARVVDHLETAPDPRNPGAPLADNTVVVVTSDNGGRTDVGGSNGPLRGQKGELHEGGTRVPWIAWSGSEDLVARGQVNPTVIDTTDLHPTLADWAEVDTPAGVDLDGDSLRAAIADGERLDRPRFAHLPGYLLAKGRDQRPESVVWRGRFKLRYSYEQRLFRLYDVTADPGETRDLAPRQGWRVARLGGDLIRWLDDLDAPLARLAPGSAPLRFEVRGSTYADGRITRQPRGRVLTVDPGEEVPLVLETR